VTKFTNVRDLILVTLCCPAKSDSDVQQTHLILKIQIERPKGHHASKMLWSQISMGYRHLSFGLLPTYLGLVHHASEYLRYASMEKMTLDV
jgi:hypothetical protein